MSQDCKVWKHISSISMNVFKIGHIPIGLITKLKGKLEGLANHKVLKITCKGDQNHYLAVKP